MLQHLQIPSLKGLKKRYILCGDLCRFSESMARKNGPTPDDYEGVSRIGFGRAEVEDYSEARADVDTADVPDSARLPELEAEPESPFLRAKKRPPVRRGPLPKKAANRLKVVAIGVLGVGALGLAVLAANHYALRSWRFRIDSSDQIQVTGNQNVPRSQVLDIFGGDISRNVFAVPLEMRRHQLEQISWIESATLMRYLPNRLVVVVQERTPVAFAQVGSRIALVDANGVLMEMPANQVKYSFPVLVGFTDAEPLSTRSARMKIYTALVRELDSGGARYSQEMSEVDLSDPEDAKVTVADGGVVLHLGNSSYLDRYKIYVSHLREWKQQFGALRSVDLRYDNQVIVDPAAPAPALAATVSTPTRKAAATSNTQKREVGAWESRSTAKSGASRRKAVSRHTLREKRAR